MDLVMLGYPASLIMGLALGLTGGGGSILTVPILVYLFGVGALQATTYSLAIVGLVALWGAFGAFREGDLNLERALVFGIPGVVGVLLSRLLFLPSIPQTFAIFDFVISKNSLVLIAFSLLMLMASASMIRSSLLIKSASQVDGEASNIAMLIGGLATGVVAGFVGAGGGFLIVPALVNLGKLDMRQAVGTSLCVISLQSLLGVAGDFNALAQIDLPLFVSVAALAVVGMAFGTKFRKRISQSKLKFGFGVFVLVVGSLILIQEIRKG